MSKKFSDFVFDWDEQKNYKLIEERNISFDEVLELIVNESFLDIIGNEKKYKNQKIFVLQIDNYVYLVPFIESGNKVFLKTIFPSRKMTKKYLGGS